MLLIPGSSFAALAALQQSLGGLKAIDGEIFRAGDDEVFSLESCKFLSQLFSFLCACSAHCSGSWSGSESG